MRDDQDGPASHNTPKATASADANCGKNSKWKPVLLPLNPHFLRLSSDRSDEFCDEFAVMLQNEEFLAELRWIVTIQWNHFFIFHFKTDSTRNSFQHSRRSKAAMSGTSRRDWNTWEKYRERNSISSLEYSRSKERNRRRQSRRTRSFSSKRARMSQRTERGLPICLLFKLSFMYSQRLS